MFCMDASALSLVWLGTVMLLALAASAESQDPTEFRTEDVKGDGGGGFYRHSGRYALEYVEPFLNG